ncbi:MAG TPA: DoxX family protein [Capsulimonadaceae bacterium]|nr:DoxX family protein [Capsulimonadaceae bacterium]
MSTRVLAQDKTTQTSSDGARASKAMLRVGYILTGLAILFLLFDAAMKLVLPTPGFVVEAGAKLGYPASTMFGIGVALLACTALYAFPRTSILGAVLLTGYLGGAVATHVRVQDGAFNILFPVIFGAIVWSGLYLRDSRVRALVPLRQTENTPAR